MSLTIKHLNSDTSFLLTFSPHTSSPPLASQTPQNYTVLLDPWLVGPSNIFHSKFSTSRHKTPPCVSSLAELPEPDLVIISQSKSDHCHKQTLTQLPASGGKTIILAEPAAAKVIRGWKYFAPEKVVTLPRWEDCRGIRMSRTSRSKLHTISIPPHTQDGIPGEVTVAFLSQKPDLTGLHSAIGITYRSPSIRLPTALSLPDTPPLTPASLYSTFSSSTHSNGNYLSASTPRPLSIIYSPHGIPYRYLSPYISSHLVPMCALPLTALLHCFDTVQNAWYLGGNICSGFPGGLEIAQNLCARVWVSAHDGEKETKGIANGKLEVRKYEREEVESVVSPRSERFPGSVNGSVRGGEKIGRNVRGVSGKGTEVVVLGSGEEIKLAGMVGAGGMIFPGGGAGLGLGIGSTLLNSSSNSDDMPDGVSLVDTPSIQLSVHE
jgi:hypothetical protein